MNFNPFTILQTKSHFGLDISSTAVKAVQLRFSGMSGKPTLVTYGAMSTSPGLIQSDSSSSKDELATTIKQVIKRAKISTQDVICALPGSSVFASVIPMPLMPRKELEEAIRWEAKQYVPSPLEEVMLDWQIMGEVSETKQTEVLLVAAPTHLVKKYMNILTLAELKPVALEIEPMALVRSLVGSDASSIVIVDIGASGTEINIIDNGIVRLIRSTASGGLALTKAISQSLGIDEERAEQFKRDFGLSKEKLEGQIPKSVKPIIDAITTEVKRSIDFYKDQKRGEIRKIILTGGSVTIPELPAHFAKTLNLEVEIGNPWTEINYAPTLASKLDEIGPSFAVPVGLAMRKI